MELKTIQSFDQTLIRYKLNKGKSPCLLFLHGSGGNYSCWMDYLESLKAHSFIAIDTRGHGHSQRGLFSLSNAVKDILHILKKEKIRNVIPIGNCIGSALALELYKTVPKKVKAMILTSVFNKRYVKYPLLTRFFRGLYYVIAAPFRLRKPKFIHFPPYFGKPYFYPVLDLLNTYHQTYFHISSILLNYSFDLTTIKVPTLIFQGARDPLTNNAKIRREAFQNKKLTYHEFNTQHFVAINCAPQIIPKIKESLNKWSA